MTPSRGDCDSPDLYPPRAPGAMVTDARIEPSRLVDNGTYHEL